MASTARPGSTGPQTVPEPSAAHTDAPGTSVVMVSGWRLAYAALIGGSLLGLAVLLHWLAGQPAKNGAAATLAAGAGVAIIVLGGWAPWLLHRQRRLLNRVDSAIAAAQRDLRTATAVEISQELLSALGQLVADLRTAEVLLMNRNPLHFELVNHAPILRGSGEEVLDAPWARDAARATAASHVHTTRTPAAGKAATRTVEQAVEQYLFGIAVAADLVLFRVTADAAGRTAHRRRLRRLEAFLHRAAGWFPDTDVPARRPYIPGRSMAERIHVRDVLDRAFSGRDDAPAESTGEEFLEAVLDGTAGAPEHDEFAEAEAEAEVQVALRTAVDRLYDLLAQPRARALPLVLAELRNIRVLLGSTPEAIAAANPSPTNPAAPATAPSTFEASGLVPSIAGGTDVDLFVLGPDTAENGVAAQTWWIPAGRWPDASR